MVSDPENPLILVGAHLNLYRCVSRLSSLDGQQRRGLQGDVRCSQHAAAWLCRINRRMCSGI